MEDGERDVLIRAGGYVRELFRGEASGHDAEHTFRVARTASRLAREEHADEFIVTLASLLHDADDVKLFPDTAERNEHAVSFMEREGLSNDVISRVILAIEDVSFRGTDSQVPSTKEGMCVQDADRLDAIGAIGIARAFSFGGSRGRAMYDPSVPPCLGMDEKAYRSSVSHTVNHFHEKLFLLKDMMNTRSAKELAAERDRYMHDFLDEFMAEWNGER